MTSATTTRRGPATASGHYRFGQVARMEWIKLRSVRSTGWLLVFVVLAMIGTGIGVGAGYRSHLPVATAAQIVNNSLGGAALAQLLIGALGVLIATSEYSSGIIRATLGAIPHRGLVLVAKLVVFGAVAFSVGELAAFAGYAAGQAAIAGSPVPQASLGDPAVLRPVLLTGAYLGLIGLIGLGLGTATRHTGGGIGALFGVLVVPMFVLVMLLVLATPVGRALGDLHRTLAARLLGEAIPPPTPVRSRGGPLGRIGAVLRDGAGWRAVAYSLVKLPLAVPQGYAVFCWVAGLVNVSYPFWWRLFRNHAPDVRLDPVPVLTPFGPFRVATFAGTFAAFAAGIAMVLAAPWIARGATTLDRALMRGLLGPGRLAQRVRDLE